MKLFSATVHVSFQEALEHELWSFTQASLF